MPTSGAGASAPTVHLAPIIKTNHAQALALEMNMINPLSSDSPHDSLYSPTSSQPTLLPASTRPTKSPQQPSSLTPSPHIHPRSALPPPTPPQPRRLNDPALSNSGMGQATSIPATTASPLTVKRVVGAGASHFLYTFPAPVLEDAAGGGRGEEKVEGEAVAERAASPTPPPTAATAQNEQLLSPHALAHTSSSSSSSSPLPPASPSQAAPPSHLSTPPEPPLVFSPSSSSWDEPAHSAALRSEPQPTSHPSQPLPSPTLTSSLISPAIAKAGPRKRLMIASGSSPFSSCLPCLSSASAASPFSSSSSPIPSADADDVPPPFSSSSSSSSSARRPSSSKRPLSRRRVTGDSGSCFTDLVTCNPCRLSFRFTLVLLCVIQVVVSVGIVWYLGYSNSTQLIGTLSNQLRQTALVELTGQMHDQLVRPMRAVNQLEYSMRRSQPYFGTPPTILNVTGLYADLSFVVFNYPQISGAGCSAPNNAFIGAINISAYLSAGASPDTTNGVTSGFAYAYQDVGQTYATYTLPPVNSSRLANPNLPLPDYNETNTIHDLGPPWYVVSPFLPPTRPQFLAAIATPGNFVWSPVYQLAKANTTRPQQTQSVIAAAKAYVNPAGGVGFVCFASIFLSRMGDLLRSLSIAYGPSGLALVLDVNGIPLACSDNALMLYTATAPTQPIFFFTDEPRLRAISAPLLSNGLYPALTNATSPTSDFAFGGVFYQNDPAFDAVPISISGSDYHLQATRLNTTGLDWVIVVVTKDTDFDGNIHSHEIVVGLLSMMVLILAIIVMVAVTQCLNRPLTLVVRYMSQVARMGRLRLPREPGERGKEEEPNAPPALSRSAEHLKQLKEIYAQWRAAVALSFDDDELEISRSRSSRSTAAMAGRGVPFSSKGGAADGSGSDDSDASVPGGAGASGDGESAASSPLKAAWWSRLIDKSAICLMREVEDMQLTFHSMLYQLTKMTAEVESTAAAKRHFVAYVFHEVRVPLNAVMLGIADLRSSCGSSSAQAVLWTEEQRDVLDIVHEQSQVVGRILNDVLSLHKIEDGALSLQYAPFSLESMILSTMQSFQPGIHDKQIHYTAQLQTVQHFVFHDKQVEELRGMPQVDVVGDKYRLRQVLANCQTLTHASRTHTCTTLSGCVTR